jgi:hypothetical protein
MKKTIIACAAVFFLFNGVVFAQEVSVRYSARTGDRSFDSNLSRMNIEARSNMDGFMTRLSVNHGVPRAKIEMMIRDMNMPPADAYMTCKISTIAKRPVDDVLQEYKANRGKGWGVIAKRMGIKPGSREFHALKKGDPDAAGPGKGKGKGKKKGKGRGRGWDRDED